ncbi:hypothetical protein CsatA_029649 [Cannabis sativa]
MTLVLLLHCRNMGELLQRRNQRWLPMKKFLKMMLKKIIKMELVFGISCFAVLKRSRYVHLQRSLCTAEGLVHVVFL